ncbi:hypothetical protein DPMN_111909 [Dreissena polymorpha]|uniref:Uncharacterized protein n=1 Tax=Dreissena polymorpha TaxID=45954 RepID=A0A9D4QPF7_DREPO|nr:hypothetical protein DPMN_111909 [Dreissena polymorpha]
MAFWVDCRRLQDVPIALSVRDSTGLLRQNNESNPEVPYRTLLKKLEGRFGAELAKSAQAKFAMALQKKGESMEDWGDRVQALATEAFRDLPESFCNQQAIDRFCQG